MALSPKQLRLVFAKLRAKGLLKYVKKGIVGPQMSRYVGVPFPVRKRSFFSEKELTSIFSHARAQQLVSRLPKKHRDMGGWAIKVKFWDSPAEGIPGYPDTSGLFELSTRTFHLERNPIAALAASGYTNPRFFIPSGYAMKQVRSGNIPSRAMLRRSAKRNAKVSMTMAFYHEYAHAMVQSRTGTGLLKDTLPEEWTRLQAKSGEWNDMDTDLSPFSLKHESFAEAYMMYAADTISRNKLRKTKPLSYEYMKKFFEET